MVFLGCTNFEKRHAREIKSEREWRKKGSQKELACNSVKMSPSNVVVSKGTRTRRGARRVIPATKPYLDMLRCQRSMREYDISRGVKFLPVPEITKLTL